jgi:hypothetical protein
MTHGPWEWSEFEPGLNVRNGCMDFITTSVELVENKTSSERCSRRVVIFRGLCFTMPDLSQAASDLLSSASLSSSALNL